jgi:hypothetical protein
MLYNLSTCDFELIRPFRSDDIYGARFLFNNRKYELHIETHMLCKPNFRATIGPLDLRKKNPLKVQHSFTLEQCEWTREALTTALIVQHSDALKQLGIEYDIRAEALDLPIDFMESEQSERQ